MMKIYLSVTGKHGSLQEFWKLSPAELLTWADAAMEKQQIMDGFEDMKIGEEVED